MGDGAPEASIKYPRIPCALNTCALLAFSQLWLRRGRKLGFPLPRACILLRGPALDSPSQSPTRSQTGHTGFPCNLPAIAPYSGYRAYAPPPDLLTHCLFQSLRAARPAQLSMDHWENIGCTAFILELHLLPQQFGLVGEACSPGTEGIHQELAKTRERERASKRRLVGNIRKEQTDNLAGQSGLPKRKAVNRLFKVTLHPLQS
ncbi:hypothetical protein IWZ01DRAFT_216833 [Phyllosticta capitalensis]